MEQVHEDVGERIRGGNEPGEEEDDATPEANQEESRMLEEYLTPEFQNWLQCSVSDAELESVLGPDPEGAVE
ncbi:unnamed protein product [Gordionus sp. m RMFG-2023]